MEKSTQLFLIMSTNKYPYCVYRVCEPESNENEDVICKLDKPIMKLHNKSCPHGMSFAVVGTNIYMVGGYYSCSQKEPFRLSNETIVFDTLSNTYAPGPPLISPKPDPFLFSVGSKLFALSMDVYADSGNPFVGPKPWFEVLHTDDIESGWRALSVPRLFVSKQHHVYPVSACVALSKGIFISVEDAGTYAFDLVKEVWNYVSGEQLPFSGQAVPMPPNLPGAPPSLCFAASTKGCGYSTFDIRYETEGDDGKRLFKVDEIEFDSSLLNLATPLPPRELYYEWSLTTTDNNSLVYLIDSGLDNFNANDTNKGKRYVKVQACDVKFSKGQSLKRLGKKKPKKREFKDSGKLLKVGRRRMKRRKKKEKDETVEFKLNPIWRRSFFGGQMVDIGEQVHAAFAIKS